jgi:hypothetical protein
MPNCAVHGCCRNKERYSKLKFYRFPTDRGRRKTWEINSGVAADENARLCEVCCLLVVDSVNNYVLILLQKQAQKRPKVFGCARIISLLNTEQNCGWVDFNVVSNPDLTCFTSRSVISVVEALMDSLIRRFMIGSINNIIHSF